MRKPHSNPFLVALLNMGMLIGYLLWSCEVERSTAHENHVVTFCYRRLESVLQTHIWVQQSTSSQLSSREPGVLDCGEHDCGRCINRASSKWCGRTMQWKVYTAAHTMGCQVGLQSGGKRNGVQEGDRREWSRRSTTFQRKATMANRKCQAQFSNPPPQRVVTNSTME